MKDLYREPTENDIIHGELNGNNKKLWLRWWAVINCIKEAIWKSRNILVFKKFSMPPESVAKLAVTIVRDYILKDKTKHEISVITELWKVPNGFVNDILKDVL